MKYLTGKIVDVSEMEEYLEAEDVDVYMISNAGLAYLDALSVFLEYVPATNTSPARRRSSAELRAILNPNFVSYTASAWMSVVIPTDPNAIFEELRQLRMHLASAVLQDFDYHEQTGINYLDDIMRDILDLNVINDFTSTLRYTVEHNGQVVYHTNDYQLANGMLLAWSVYRELVSVLHKLPLTMSLNSQLLDGGMDIAIGLEEEYHMPAPGDLYFMALFTEITTSEESFEYAVIDDPRYLQGYASMIHWLNTLYPIPGSDISILLWSSIRYNNNGEWYDAELA